MADATDWGQDDLAPPRKRGLPTWLLACGGGCLATIVIAVVGLAIAWDSIQGYFQDAQNPDVQWPKVAEVLPFDERPDYEIFGLPIPFGMRAWTLVDHERGLLGTLMDFGSRSGQELEGLFDPELTVPFADLIPNAGRHDAERTTVTVQGRELRALRYSTTPSADDEAGPRGDGLNLDLTPPEGRPLLALQLTRSGVRAPITDDDARAFLAPFELGPERVPGARDDPPEPSPETGSPDGADDGDDR